jgi:osmotically-inducible protein OsmY
VKSNSELETDIRAELVWDPKVKHPDEIAVAADRGTVTLRGTVGSLHQRKAAVTAAKRIRGTFDVNDELDVRLMDKWAVGDADIRGAALQALHWNVVVPADRLDVKVDAGHAVLMGTVDWRYEKDVAEATVANLLGVVGVRNEIEVVSTATALDGMSARIEDAFKRSAQTHANDILISVTDGEVTLQGTVTSWAEHDEALAAAASAPGVLSVDDQLSIAA